MINRLQQPSTPKGLDSAIALLNVIANHKELIKLTNQLKEYSDQANEYFSIYGGVEKAKRYIEEAETQAQAIVERATTYRASVEEELDKKRRDINDSNQTLSKKAQELNDKREVLEKRKQDLDKWEITIESRSKDIEVREKETARKEEELNKFKEELDKRATKLDNITKALGEV